MTSPEDFTYNYLRRLFATVLSKFRLRVLGDGLETEPDGLQLFVRHDVDVSLKHALTLAEIESECGIRATYMFIPNSRLYDIRSSGNILRAIGSLGHEVALHFDVDDIGRRHGANISDVLTAIEHDCQKISNITGSPVRSVSFHRPMQQFIGGDLTVCGRINAYAAQLMKCYISDSKGQWRNGEPIPTLLSTTASVVQLLLHPIWYGDNCMDPQHRLEEFFLGETAGLSSADRNRFDVDLAFTIPGVRRANYEGV